MKRFKSKHALVFGSVFGFAMLVSLTAPAAPAVVSKFEATAREEPSTDAPPVHVFSEQTKLSVSEEVTDGWRRVRVPEGQMAFIRDEDIRLATPAVAPIQPLPRGARGETGSGHTSADRIVYVKDLDHLAELVKEDSLVQPKAAALAHRQFAAKAMIWGGGLAGTLGALAGMTLLAGQTCSEGYCQKELNQPVVYGSIAFAMISTAVGWAILPNRADVLDVLNDWNRRHASTPFTFDRQPSYGY